MLQCTRLVPPGLYSIESFLQVSLCFVYPKQGKPTGSDEDDEVGGAVMVLSQNAWL